MNLISLYRAPLEHVYLDRDIFDAHHRLLVRHLLEDFGVEPGDKILEIGAGSGRYTRLLLDYGLRILALEPDPLLAGKFREGLAGREGVRVMESPAEDCGLLLEDVRLVCGFHVLHHLPETVLSILGQALARRAAGRSFRGWFFMEPNPRCPFYPVQILCTPSMRFAEERGIWRSDYRKLTGGEPPRLGDVGLFLPRPATASLPWWVQSRATRLTPRRTIFRIYSVYGMRSRG